MLIFVSEKTTFAFFANGELGIKAISGIHRLPTNELRLETVTISFEMLMIQLAIQKENYVIQWENSLI